MAENALLFLVEDYKMRLQHNMLSPRINSFQVSSVLLEGVRPQISFSSDVFRGDLQFFCTFHLFRRDAGVQQDL